jgi:hypothetical protein
MFRPHPHRHAANPAGNGTSAAPAPAMEQLNTGSFAKAQFLQPVAVVGAQGYPVDSVDISGQAGAEGK